MNRLKILFALAAALALAGCGGAAVETRRDTAAAPSATAQSASPAPVAPTDAATVNASAPSSTPAAAAAAQPSAPQAGGARGAGRAPSAPAPTPRIGSGGNDFFLFTQARAAVDSDAELKAANLTLDVKEGVVTLKGNVANAALKSKAEELVRGVGPKNVRNQLRVAAGN